MRHIIIGIIVWAGVGIIVLPFMLGGEGIEQIESQQTPPSAKITDLNLQPIEDSAFQEAITIKSDSVAKPLPIDNGSQPKASKLDEPALNTQTKTADSKNVTSTDNTPNNTVKKPTVDAKVDNDISKKPPNLQPEALVSDPKIDNGWSIQLGSFKNERNALALEKKINKAGYPTFVQAKDDFVQMTTRHTTRVLLVYLVKNQTY